MASGCYGPFCTCRPENQPDYVPCEEQLEQAQAEVKRLVAEAVRADQALQAAYATSLDALRLQEQAQAEIARLREACSLAYGYIIPRSPNDNVRNAVINALEAALAEDADGELKPEVEANLMRSLKIPREEMLTPDEMRQKLEGADAT